MTTNLSAKKGLPVSKATELFVLKAEANIPYD